MSNAVLLNSHFVPCRGGHAPNDVRDAFKEAVEAFLNWKSGEPEPKVEVRGKLLPISKVAGLLWNCRDIMPRDYVDDLDGVSHYADKPLLAGASYSRGARRLKSLIKSNS
jgi:hypothetical protein